MQRREAGLRARTEGARHIKKTHWRASVRQPRRREAAGLPPEDGGCWRRRRQERVRPRRSGQEQSCHNAKCVWLSGNISNLESLMISLPRREEATPPRGCRAPLLARNLGEGTPQLGFIGGQPSGGR
ncbi:unnamed protein product [Prorocentrum cordatum]|uniref:Uncharacterized protein n=1 Tax=Prorocentrum cordatum TaxID=2364126 RepID=A0ABN9TUJ3_9DINO|nr:unnamed protein product [Polarella glacialis]